jgi:16S rRNA (guanine527-N7)-methyltransferase
MLAGRDGARVTLIESDSRKAAFLGEVARRTGAPVDIRPERIEKAATQAKVGPVDVITARALAPLPRLLELAAPAFSDHTVGLFLKGREAEGEVAAARERWAFAGELQPSVTDGSGRIIVIRALKAKTPEAKTGDQPR